MKVLIYGWGSAEHLGITEVNDAMTSLVNKLGHEPVYLDDEVVCAEGLGALGYGKQMRKIAPVLVKLMENSGADVAVTPFAASYYVWNYTLKDIPRKIPVIHVVQYLHRELSSKRPVFREYEKRVLIHDGCRLGRYSGVVKEPRAVLKMVPKLKLVEFEHPDMEARGTKPWDIAPCPGSWLEITMNPLMPYVADNVLRRDVEPLNVDVLTTTCANGYHAFKAGKEFGHRDVEVKFIANLVDEVLVEVSE